MSEAPKYLIWWISNADAHHVEDMDTSWPPYIDRQFTSRCGRNGRGRLWCASKFEKDPECPESADFGQAHDGWAAAAGEAGGIVIKATDIAHVITLPGFVTTFSLEPVRVEVLASLLPRAPAST